MLRHRTSLHTPTSPPAQNFAHRIVATGPLGEGINKSFTNKNQSYSRTRYSENSYAAPPPLGTWRSIGLNPADVFLQSAQFLVSAQRVQELIREFHPVRQY